MARKPILTRGSFPTRRLQRTRPSTARPGIVLDSEDFTVDFYNTGDTSYVTPKKARKKSKKQLRKEQEEREFQLGLEQNYKQLNTLFGSAEDFSLIIEKVPVDRYVMPESTAKDDEFITNHNDTSIWPELNNSACIDLSADENIPSEHAPNQSITIAVQQDFDASTRAARRVSSLAPIADHVMSASQVEEEFSIVQPENSACLSADENIFHQSIVVQQDSTGLAPVAPSPISSDDASTRTARRVSSLAPVVMSEPASQVEEEFSIVQPENSACLSAVENIFHQSTALQRDFDASARTARRVSSLAPVADHVMSEPAAQGDKESGIVQPENSACLSAVENIFHQSTALQRDFDASARTARRVSSLAPVASSPISSDDAFSSDDDETCMPAKNNISIMANKCVSKFYYLRDFDAEHTDINILLHVCEQSAILSWHEFLMNGSAYRKLGEGAYGEVYYLKFDNTPVAMKVIPFLDVEPTYEGLVNGDRLKTTLEVLPELLIAKELSALSKERNGYATPNFVQLVRACVVRGDYPIPLLKEWDRFKKAKHSENDRPDVYSSERQLFITFALSLGGPDLESYAIKNEREAFSIFFQIALSLLVAEEVLEFEHRDLHWGNVLIGSCRQNTEINYMIDGEEITMKSFGVQVSIIDFTNSRLRRGDTTIYLDLSTDEELFNGRGDYQFDIYRLMRERNGDDWKKFSPCTNLLWLHYIASKVFSAKKIEPRQRKCILAEMDKLLAADRIRNFLKDAEISRRFSEHVTKGNIP